MPQSYEFDPAWAAPPGATIGRVLHEKGISSAQLASELKQTDSFVTDLLNGGRHITVELAKSLASAIGSTERFWLTRESQYRQALRRLCDSDKALQSWAASLPVVEMMRLGWIDKSSSEDAAIDCLGFLGISSVERWRAKYLEPNTCASFRASSTLATDKAAALAWLRRGELDAMRIDCAEWNAAKFARQLARIRGLSRRKSPGLFLADLQALCAQCGVAVVVAGAPRQCKASGAARFVSPNKALIVLSYRHRTDDHFWFTFFHEAGHVLKHGHDCVFLDSPDETGGLAEERKEREANEFAAEQLLSRDQRESLGTLTLSYESILRFARGAGVSPGIVVGQLQHSKRIRFDEFSKVKRRYEWDEENPA